jgi:hypothetical protein
MPTTIILWLILAVGPDGYSNTLWEFPSRAQCLAYLPTVPNVIEPEYAISKCKPFIVRPTEWERPVTPE